MPGSDAFLASLAINGGVATAFFIAFSLLRPRTDATYAPRLLSAENTPPKLPPGFFGWLGPLLSIDEDEVVKSAGLVRGAFACLCDDKISVHLEPRIVQNLILYLHRHPKYTGHIVLSLASYNEDLSAHALWKTPCFSYT